MSEKQISKELSIEIDKAIVDDIVERFRFITFLQEESVFTGGVAQRESIQSKVNDVMKAPKATE